MGSPRTKARARWLVGGAILAVGIVWWIARPRDVVAPDARAASSSDTPTDRGGSELVGVGTERRPAKRETAGMTDASHPSTENEVVRFRGIAVDEAGTPVASAEISVQGSTQRKTGPVPPVVTGTDGRFAFEVKTQESGLRIDGRATGRTLVGSEAYVARDKEARLVFVVAATVRVRVLDDATGVAVEGALVRTTSGMWVSAAFASELDVPFSDEAVTDATGRATLATEGGPANVLVVPKAHAPVLVPRVNVPATGRDLDVRVSRGGVVEGRVLDPSGLPVGGASVRVESNPLLRRDTTSGADGRFRFEGVAGGPAEPDADPDDLRAAVFVSANGWAYGYAPIELPKPGATTAIDVRLRSGHRITGIVESVEHRPAAGFSVEAEPAEGDTFYFRRTDRFRATTAADGRFEFLLVPPGPVQLMASSSIGSIYVKESVLVPDDGDPPPVVIVLPDTRGRLTVRVVAADGSGVAGAKIEIKSGPPVIHTVGAGTTDAHGVAKLDGLPVDQATVLVRPTGSTTLSRGVGAAELRGGAVVFQLEGGVIAGRALQSDGGPARVRLALERLIPPCMERGEAVATDDDGRFRFAHLPDDQYQLHVEGEENVLITASPGFRPGETELLLWIVGTAEAARHHLEFLLVEDATGKSVPAAKASIEVVTVSGGPRQRRTEMSTGPASEPGRFVSYSTFPPGVYDVVLTSGGWRSVRLPGIKIPRDGEPPVVRLDPGARVNGRLSWADGTPVEDAHVGVGDQGTTSAADGTFSLTGLEVGEQDAVAGGDFVLGEKRRVTVPGSGIGRLDWTLRPAGGLAIRFGASTDASRERVVLTPLAGGDAESEDDEPGALWNEEHQGPRWTNLAPGRYRVAAWQGTREHPAQEVEVRARETTRVRFPPAAESAPPK